MVVQPIVEQRCRVDGIIVENHMLREVRLSMLTFRKAIRCAKLPQLSHLFFVFHNHNKGAGG